MYHRVGWSQADPVMSSSRSPQGGKKFTDEGRTASQSHEINTHNSIFSLKSCPASLSFLYVYLNVIQLKLTWWRTHSSAKRCCYYLGKEFSAETITQNSKQKRCFNHTWVSREYPCHFLAASHTETWFLQVHCVFFNTCTQSKPAWFCLPEQTHMTFALLQLGTISTNPCLVYSLPKAHVIPISYKHSTR